jgi:hypothetical protein
VIGGVAEGSVIEAAAETCEGSALDRWREAVIVAMSLSVSKRAA